MAEILDEDNLQRVECKKEERLEDKYRLYATLAFTAVVIAIGIPMWWKTTEVFRVHLPSSAIMNMNDDALRVKLTVNIFTFNNDRGKMLIKELTELYANQELWLIDWKQIEYFEEASHVKTPAALENYILEHHVNVTEGDFLFIEWLKMQDDLLITNDRTAFMKTDCSSNKISQVLNLYILQTYRIHQIMTKDPKLSIKTEAPQPEYDVIVSVLNPRPDIMDVKWHVPMAVNSYLKPYLERVSHISNFTIKTQWKYQLQFETDLKQIRDNSILGRHYILAEKSLPHIITAIEKNLGVGITNRTPINLLVYVIPCDIAPVYIVSNDENENHNKTINAFISSKWGGFIIVNPPLEICKQHQENSEKISFYIQTNDVMQIMLYQLQKLLDITVEVTISGVKVVELSELAPRKWEYEAYLRRSAITHIVTTTNTLQSLIKLLDNISYIVINENVGALINVAYETISLAKAALIRNDLLEASTLARKAFVASEQAFFDASLLAQLYFPDEQKYAIYIPLFLPVMVPVLTSFSMIWKLMKSQLTEIEHEKID